MTRHNPELAQSLRQTADRLGQGDVRYEWGHMGRCNCGHLLQTISNLSDYQIVESLDFQLDEWSEYAQDYCPGTGQKVEDLFETLQNVGFSREDVIHLENLSDKRVLRNLPGGFRYLRRNQIEDVRAYMYSYADLLETKSETKANHSTPIAV